MTVQAIRARTRHEHTLLGLPRTSLVPSRRPFPQQRREVSERILVARIESKGLLESRFCALLVTCPCASEAQLGVEERRHGAPRMQLLLEEPDRLVVLAKLCVRDG
jgi:hypothetical protein